MSQTQLVTCAVATIAAVAFTAGISHAQTGTPNQCSSLPNHGTLKAALDKATAEEKSGLNNHMRATIVDRDGVVCAVAFSGTDRAAQWPGSRVISAQKASTANSFGLDSTSNRGRVRVSNRPRVVDGEPLLRGAAWWNLFGLQFSNPVEHVGRVSRTVRELRLAKGSDDRRPCRRGERVRRRSWTLRSRQEDLGGVGVSGDTSCADHNIAWRLRAILGLDHMTGVGGVSGDKARPDNIIFDVTNGTSKGGFGHPQCPNTSDASMLPAVKE